MRPRVSILLPVYNVRAEWIRALCCSINDQTFADWQLVVSFDAKEQFSQDVMRVIISSINQKEACIFVTALHGGISETLNAGLDLCNSEFILRVDADDMLMPDRIQAQVDFLDSHPEYIGCGTQIVAIDNHGDCLNATLWQYPTTFESFLFFGALINTPLAHPTLIVRTAAIKSIHGYRALPCLEDYDLHSRLAVHGKMASLSYVGLKYRIHSNQLSNLQKPKGRHLFLIRLRFLYCLVRSKWPYALLLVVPIVYFILGPYGEVTLRRMGRGCCNAASKLGFKLTASR